MNYLRSFAPWIVYAVVGTQVDWRYSALVGLALAAVIVLWERRENVPPDAMVIELSAGLFFVLLSIFAFASPDSPLRDQVVTMSSAWLALTAWGSLAVRKPFTLGIGRRMVEPEIAADPLFRRTNVVITAVWATAFTAEAIAMGILLTTAPHATAAAIVIKIAAFAVPVTFTIRYSNVVRARAMKAALQGELR